MLTIEQFLAVCFGLFVLISGIVFFIDYITYRRKMKENLRRAEERRRMAEDSRDLYAAECRRYYIAYKKERELAAKYRKQAQNEKQI
ncbi:MAG: hypothetical protein IIW79_06220 [Clostridia bacterium]|nr:hypothetical protein [Clostridia bacterium]